MSENENPIEDRIEEEINHLLDFMQNENDYTDNYKSMVGQFTRVMELRQQEANNKISSELKDRELRQQEENNKSNIEMKDRELQQQQYTSNWTNELKDRELQQQKQINDTAVDLEFAKLNKNSISKETWLTVGTHLAGMVVIMNHERAHVIASKAFGLLKKLF